MVTPCVFGAPLVAVQGQTMGTTYSVKVAQDVADVAGLKHKIDGVLERVNAVASTYRSKSDISKFNQSSSKDWFPVAPLLVQWVRTSQRIGKVTGGAFDATAMNLVNLWGFGPKSIPRKSPSDSELNAVMKRRKYHVLSARTQPPALKKSHPHLSIDLSGVAKGAGVDLVAELLESQGLKNYFVEIGGEIRTKGHKSGPQPWRVAIEKPDAMGRGIQKIIELGDAALATSGDYRNYYEEKGKRLSHIIDPRSGRPITHRLASVTVRAKTCEEADAYATAFMVLGVEAAKAVAKQQGLDALFIVRQGMGFKEVTTSGFHSLGTIK